MKTVVVVGAGGNIGSHLVPHLARLPGVAQVTLIDRDVYEPKNLASQDITPGDVGKGKAVVQARRLRRISPTLRVVAVREAVERVPLGRLRGDVILACLDTRAGRQYVNEAAWRLGVAWIDSGVEAGGLLARVNVYVPGPDAACLECAWDERDYQALEQSYPCPGSSGQAYPTSAPASLGALAAALQAIECQKLLAGEWDQAAIGGQVLLDARCHKQYLTAFRRNPACRFPHPEPWVITGLDRSPRELTIGQALELGEQAEGACSLRVEGQRFVRRLVCTGCGRKKSLLRLERSLRPAERKCVRCGQARVASGFDQLEELCAGRLSQRERARSLRGVGFRPREVFTLRSPAQESHYEITGDGV